MSAIAGKTLSVPICCDEVVVIGIPDEFAVLCASYKLDPVEILAGFMADAAGFDGEGFVTGGSDERMQARGYIERRWFYMR